MLRIRLWFIVPLLMLLGACNTDPKVVSKKYVDNGNKYFDRGKYKEARIMYLRALSKNMRYADGWYRLGLTNLRLGIPQEARRDFSRATEIDPGNTDAIVKLGEINLFFYLLDTQMNRSLLTDLKDETQQLLKRDPKSFDGLRFSGYIALMQKDLKTAIEKFKEANQVKAYQPELVLSLVQALFASQANEEAETFAKGLIERQKAYGPIYDVLYMHYIRSNHPELAEALIKQKVDNNPTQGPFLLQLAFHYFVTNRKGDMTATLARLTSAPKTFPDNHMQVGDFYMRIRDFDSALQQYDQGQKDDPKNKRTYQKKMVEVLGTQGKTDQASKIVTTLLKDDPKDPEAIAMHATLLLQTGDRRQIKTVIAELQPLVSKMPGNATLHFNLGRAYMLDNDPQSQDQARVQFLEALKIEPKYLPARLSLAQLEMQRGEFGKVVQTADEILTLDQTNMLARLIRARGLIGMGENAKAREEVNTVLKLYPRSTDALFQLAELDYMERRFKEAEAGFQLLVQANDPRGLPGVMESRIGQGQWDQALKFADDHIRQSPDRVDYRSALAQMYFRAGKYSEATAQYQLLLDKHPKADFAIRLGECKRYGRDYKGAIDAFTKARELEPNNFIPILELALMYDENMGRHEEARKAYEDVIKLQPDNSTALNNLAYLKADNGVDLDLALSYAQRAQQKEPNNTAITDTVAFIYIQKNLTDDGLRMLRDLVTREPNNPTFHLHLAMALYQKGDRPQAKREIEAAQRNKPSEREQDKIKQLLPKIG